MRGARASATSAQARPDFETPRSEFGYLPALDGLRAVAVLLVVAFHSELSGFSGGFIGVEIFFALSGYLITTLIAREYSRTGGLDGSAFFLRRIARLLPAILVVLVGAVAIGLMTGFPPGVLNLEALSVALFMTDYTMALLGFPILMTHTWSLSVEMHYYLVWPFVMLACLRRMAPGTLARVLIGLAIAVWTWRVAAHVVIGPAYAYHATDTRISGLIVGSALALGRWPRSVGGRRLLLAGSLLVLALAVATLRLMSFGAALAAPLVELASAGIVCSLLGGSGLLGRALSLPAAVWLGRISYGIYLWHFPVLTVVLVALDPPPLAVFALTAGLSVALAALSFAFVEQPARHWMAGRLARAASARRTAAVAGAHDDDAAHAGQRDARE